MQWARKNAFSGRKCDEGTRIPWVLENAIGPWVLEKAIGKRRPRSSCTGMSSLPFQTPESRKWVGYALLTQKNIYWYLAWNELQHCIHKCIKRPKWDLNLFPGVLPPILKAKKALGENRFTHSTNLAKHNVYNLRTQMFFYELLWIKKSRCNERGISPEGNNRTFKVCWWFFWLLEFPGSKAS